MNAFRGFITGAVLGLVCWSALGLAVIYHNAPAQGATECAPDTNCKGLPIDKD